ncbi:MAG: DUF938 domain-containing protein [Gammaproteobacteria bacterium]|nr:DUF938 domain-containing protein [Gammaproteobacteria bacterium]
MQGFSQAADNNKAPILKGLSQWLPSNAHVLELGSGAGQHAIFLAAALKGISWQPTERKEKLGILKENIANYGTGNILPPVALDLSQNRWPKKNADCVYCANVIHIIRPTLGESLITGAARTLAQGGLLALYGPFKYEGQFTTLSNCNFDHWLKTQDLRSGIRDFEWVCKLAKNHDLSLAEDRPMPANNRLLIFRR